MATKLITTGELLLAPTGLDWSTLAEKLGLTDQDPSSAAQAIEQAFIIDSASEWVANFCEQTRGLQSTQQTEVARIARVAHFGTKAWVDSEGTLKFKAEGLPITSVDAMSYAMSPGPLVYNTIAPGSTQITGRHPQMFTISEMSSNWEPLKFSAAYLQVQYTAGYPNAVLTAAVTAGANKTLTVDSTLGMATSNTQNPEMLTYQSNLRIYDGLLSEDVVVTSVLDATRITVANLVNAHDPTSGQGLVGGIGVSGLPRDIKWATIMAATHFARQRGTQAMTMNSARGSMASKSAGDLLSEAEFLLEPWVMKV